MKKPLTIAILALGLQFVVAEDIKTLTGKEYKDATISRAEPDGLVLMYSAGIVKVPFNELPPEYAKKYGYDPKAAQNYRVQVDQATALREADVAVAKEQRRQFNLSGLTPSPRPSAPPKHSLGLERTAPSGSVSLARVFSDYDKNQLNADILYKGKTFTIGGTIKAITSEDSGPVIEMQVECNNACWCYAHFLPAEAGALAQFREGNRLTFVGTVVGLRNYTLRLKNCYLPR